MKEKNTVDKMIFAVLLGALVVLAMLAGCLIVLVCKIQW